MKLATLKDRTRDGTLVVVSRDLTRSVSTRPIVATLQAALDDWDHVAPRLAELAHQLERDAVPTQRFHERDALAPLPRAYAWVDGSAYVNHVELVRRARGSPMPDSFWTDPLMYQGGSDTLLPPRDPIRMPSQDFGIDLEGEVAVITGDVPFGASREVAAAAIRLVMLANDVSLRNLIPAELAKGFGFFQAKPSTTFSPVAVTTDELGDAWDGARLHLPLLVSINDVPLGRAEAGRDMTFGFPELIAHAARTRALCAGTIVGSGTVSNKGADQGPGSPVAEGGAGFSCLAELRTVETIATGSPVTPFLRFGDRVRIEMTGRAGRSIFGAIEQTVERLGDA